MTFLEVLVTFLVFLLAFNCDESKSTTNYQRENFYTLIVFSVLTVIQVALLIDEIVRTIKEGNQEYWEVTLAHFVGYIGISLVIGIVTVVGISRRDKERAKSFID